MIIKEVSFRLEIIQVYFVSKKRTSISDIKAAGLLARKGVAGIVDIVEAIHYNIARLGGILGKNENMRLNGISGLVYKNIRSITEISSDGFEVLMDKLSRLVKERAPGQKRQALLAAINGVLGDYLFEKNSPLAIPMQLRYDGKLITGIEQVLKIRKSKIVLLVHGSCMNDLHWKRKGHDHGSMLSQDLGFAPLYLCYNSGRHISENGKELAAGSGFRQGTIRDVNGTDTQIIWIENQTSKPVVIEISK